MISTMTMTHAVSMEGIIIGDQTTVRNGSGFDQSKIASLPIGTAISILSVENDWYQISEEKLQLSGWVFKDLIAIQQDSELEVMKKARVNASLLNVRSAPSTEAHRITQLSNGQEVKVISTSGDWIQIQLNDGQNGWVHSEFVIMIPNFPRGAINKNEAKVYDKMNSTLVEISNFQQGQMVYIKDYDEDYFDILTEEGFAGWVKRTDVSLIINGENPVTRGTIRANASEFVSVTKKYLGKPYRYATTGPNSFDCSGYVYYILHKYYGDQLKENNINLPRSSRAMASVGTPVSRDNLEVGDLVFFNNTSGSINHVGLYLGNNQFIHASSGSSMSVIISPLNTGTYNNRYNTARRLF